MLQAIDIDALYKIQYGMYIISSKFNKKLNGQIATAVMQVTNDPIQVSICLAKKNLTHAMVQNSNIFGISVLSQDTPMTFIGKFGYKCGKDIDKCANLNLEQNITGCPLILDHALMVLEAKVNNTLDVGTHTMFVGEVLSAKQIRAGIAMTYEYYHTVIKGKSPENAPTYMNR